MHGLNKMHICNTLVVWFTNLASNIMPEFVNEYIRMESSMGSKHSSHSAASPPIPKPCESFSWNLQQTLHIIGVVYNFCMYCTENRLKNIVSTVKCRSEIRGPRYVCLRLLTVFINHDAHREWTQPTGDWEQRERNFVDRSRHG